MSKTKAHGWVNERPVERIAENGRVVVWRDSAPTGDYPTEPTCLIKPETVDRVREFINNAHVYDNDSYAGELLKLLPEGEE